MAFGIGINTEHPEQSCPAGEYRDVAVKCWFTSNGKAMPLMMKVQTEQDGIIPIENLKVLTSEKQWYAGILTWKYRCRTLVNGREQEFILLFRPDECSWKLVV